MANKTFGGRKAKLFTVIDFCTLPFFPNLWNCAMNLLKHANFLSCFFCIKNDVSKKWGGKFSPRPDDNFSIVFRQKTTESNWIMVAIKVIHHCCLSKFLMIFCDTQCGINYFSRKKRNWEKSSNCDFWIFKEKNRENSKFWFLARKFK